MTGRGVVLLDGVLRRYEWGSPTVIPELLGIEPDGRPVAELWFGAHPDDPSPVPVRGMTLAEVIDHDGPAVLGDGVVQRFGPRLPFLLKVLAARTSLSIQVHPTSAQAAAGFAAEDAAGIDRASPARNYRDGQHKPELLCALTDFHALCGFRPARQTVSLLDDLDVVELIFLREALSGPDPLRAAVYALLNHPAPGPVVAALARRLEGCTDPAVQGVRLAAQDFPDDIGVVVALLLNHVQLQPGEAIFLGAGTMHAYLRGTGVEIMANSDNVLRCGLTGKHIDVDEVLRITDFSPLAEPRCAAVHGSFDVPVPDFRLVRVDVDEPTGLDDAGPLIVLCTSGSIGVGRVDLARGRAAFVPAGQRVTLSGIGVAFVAGVGLPR